MSRRDTCEQVQRELLPGPGGDAGFLTETVRAHLESCADCRAVFEERQQLAAAVSALPVRPATGPTLRSFSAARAALEARADEDLLRQEADLRRWLAPLRRRRAPASVIDGLRRALGLRDARRLRVLRTVGTLAAAAGLVLAAVLGLRRPSPPATPSLGGFLVQEGRIEVRTEVSGAARDVLRQRLGVSVPGLLRGPDR